MRPVWPRLALRHSYAVGQPALVVALVGLVGVGRSGETFNSVAFGCISSHFPNPHPCILTWKAGQTVSSWVYARPWVSVVAPPLPIIEPEQLPGPPSPYLQGRAQGEPMSTDAPVFIGIDVSKEWVDVAVRPTGTPGESTKAKKG